MAQRTKNVNQVTATLRIGNFANAIRQVSDKLITVTASKYAGKDKAGQSVYSNYEVRIFTQGDNATNNKFGKLEPGKDILVTGSLGQIRAFQKKDGGVDAEITILASEISAPETEEVPDAPAAAAPAPAAAAQNFI
jgi:hypothetical protein